MQYGFDKFILDTGQWHLTAGGAALDADARQLHLLSLLIGAYPDCCERQFLLDQLWPNTVVSHWSLGRLVSDTRKWFREQGYQGPLIQTLHGRGYRLSPELAERMQPLAESAAEELPLPDRPDVAMIPEPLPAMEGGAATEFSEHSPAPAPAPDSAAAAPPRLSYWRTLAGLGVLLLITALTVYLITARRIPSEGVPLVIGEAPNVRGRLLWVDDNPDNNIAERSYFESQGVAVYIATNTEDALVLLSMYRYDAVISDMGRGDEPLAGFKLMERIRSKQNQTPYFLYTIMPSESQRQLVRQRGGNGVAVTSEELYQLVLPLLERQSGAEPEGQSSLP
ncbi:response regulator [Microbulbifer sp. ALW1]|uniref:response regulator n=1 Tax=Microbulbifer sp. (strain ALW1) TaxID=1516059 RepID=UPI001358A71D|nr:response regulator [Microbulbifer sp. ALW1]